MERIDLFIKGTVGVIGTFVSYLVDGFGLAFAILLGMMALDYISGLMVAISTKTLSSSVGIKGLIKKMYIIILIGAIYLLGLAIEGLNYIGDGVAIAYIGIEFISLAENGGKLGVPLGPIKKVIAVLKNQDGEK